jgi:uncharacterized membrane protein YgcG
MTDTISGGVRVYLGDPNRTVAAGEHVYRLRYVTTRQIGFFADHDELYWNATGTGWVFPIGQAQARIRLPQAVDFGRREVYTGLAGATGKNARVISEQPGEIVFRTTAPLDAYEGLTVAAAWPKGVVAQPSGARRAWLWLTDMAGYVTGGLGLLAVLAYYAIAWLRVGRDPPAGTIVPLFAPPDRLCAAAMRYIVEMGMDNRVFAAALVELGVKGKLSLVEGKKEWLGRPQMTIKRREADANARDDVPPREEARVLDPILKRMFGSLLPEGRDSIVMKQENHATFHRASSVLESGLQAAYEGKLFFQNRFWATRGVVLLGLVLWATLGVMLLSVPDFFPLFSWLVLAGSLILAAGIVPRCLDSARAARWRVIGDRVAVIGGGLLAFLLFPIIFNGNFVEVRALPLMIPLLALPLAVTAFWWMAAPTRQGRATLDHIAGFKQYLSITEEDRLERLNPPEKTPELFERYLPYAIALGVENAWANRFANVLATASAADAEQASSSMKWYAGRDNPWTHTNAFVGSVGSSLASGLASASSAPSASSSSGSSGGGSSGGGGGGGGGGGW